MLPNFLALSVALLAIAQPTHADLPYNPVQLILSSDKSKVYQLFPEESSISFSYFDVSRQISASTTPITVRASFPSETTNQAFVAAADSDGITAVIGPCQQSNDSAELWRFVFGSDGTSGTWNNVQIATSDTPLSANYLSAAFEFSANGSASDTSLYIFGGMCPSGGSNSTAWTSQATYSNSMLAVSPTSNLSQFQVSFSGTRTPPIPEAGLTVTPLSLSTSHSSSGQVSQQQNFVLLGGNTQTAFINMSSVALFSLPEASWTFIAVDQPSGTEGELIKRGNTIVEPRSGHTAVLTEDGSKIVMFGGWVGNVTNPATPQLAILSLGQGYGGTAGWQWSVPNANAIPLSTGQGIYGHGAVMLPGNIMMISGGTAIGISKQKRATQTYMFYNVDTGVWSSTYRNSAIDVSNGLDSTQKAGLGAGLGLGLSAMIAILAVWLAYRKRLNKRRSEREKYLRELAFGSDRMQSNSRVGSMNLRQVGGCDVRSASWGSRQEQQIESNGFKFPWSGQQTSNVKKYTSHDPSNEVERTALEVPSPTRGLRKSLSSRGNAAHGSTFMPSTGPGSVLRIDEVEEDGSVGSLRAKTPSPSRLSDPFKDSPNLRPRSAAEERKREVQGWVEGWQEAAASMNLSRNPSHARTYSNLSQAHSISDASSYQTGRESPDKSDRTSSNLSEQSLFSIQKSVGTVSRQVSQRSVSAGYALFAGAAAAMGRLSTSNREAGLERAASKRSVSLNTAGAAKRAGSGAQRSRVGETHALLYDRSPTKALADDVAIKDYKGYSRANSRASQRKKAGILGSVKRVLTGTQNVDVQAHVEQYEEKRDETQPPRPEVEMSESIVNTPIFWKSKRGARDWDDENLTSEQPSLSSNRIMPTIEVPNGPEDYDGEDWDVETAVQKRVVQVMFTMPKEKLRVVNADAVSLISRSDVDEKEEKERKTELHRMDSVNEDEVDTSHCEVQGKGKERAKEREQRNEAMNTGFGTPI